MMIRPTFITFVTAALFSSLSLTLLAEDSAVIKHVAARSVPESSFKRISEYFDQTENTGGKLILRTEPKQRAGYYFMLSLQRHAVTALVDGTIELHYVKEGERLHILETFPVPASPPPCNEIWLGLTGGSALADNETIMAWKIVIRQPDGQVLDTQQSFLWQ